MLIIFIYDKPITAQKISKKVSIIFHLLAKRYFKMAKF